MRASQGWVRILLIGLPHWLTRRRSSIENHRYELSFDPRNHLNLAKESLAIVL